MFSYLQFLVKSTNQHGVHSPFVYNYITKGLYEPQKDFSNSDKTNRWLIKSVQYFKSEAVYISDNTLLHGSKFVSIKKTVDFHTADLILDRYEVENHTRILQTIKSMSNSQLLLIASYSSYPKSFFNELRNNHEITLVVDFYYGCLISKRIEQPKQNFFIRY